MVNNLAEVLPAIATNFGMESKVAWNRSVAERVIVILIDGMGLENLEEDFAPADFGVSSFGEIACTFPSTTPVSLTTFGLGMTPAEHGMVGATFWLPEFQQLLRPLHWEETPNPIAVQPEATWFETINTRVPVVRIGPEKYANSGLSVAALRGGTHIGADSLADIQIALRNWWSSNSVGLAYAYYPDLDKIGHVHGTKSAEWKTELEKVRENLVAIASELPGNTHMLVTADHGMLNVESRFWIESAPILQSGVRMITGEPRFRHIYAQSGKANAVYKNWQSISDIAEILTRAEAFEAGIFGAVDDYYADRVGDVIAIAKAGNILGAESIDRKVSNLLGLHGGTSSVESRIPLIEMAG
jgi:predicted AlkP superfamily pyrophosphatase or phosphodiesterase